jgi:antitoxin component YwqK of YwqJK toxin-antitoxin module
MGRRLSANSAHYRSSIPTTARERVVERYPNGNKRQAEYRLRGKVVGMRIFFESGEPEMEYGLRDGQKHGIEYDWIAPGMLTAAEPFVCGLAHGTVRQWDQHGRLMGTYRMVHGTGLDLWRLPREGGGEPYLAEVLYWKNGHRDGFEWWLDENQKTVYIERHWRQSELHGIERQWNAVGRLARGYPKYFVGGQRMTKRQYLKAAAADPALPLFKAKENRSARTFPPDVAIHLRRPRAKLKRSVD